MNSRRLFVLLTFAILVLIGLVACLTWSLFHATIPEPEPLAGPAPTAAESHPATSVVSQVEIPIVPAPTAPPGSPGSAPALPPIPAAVTPVAPPDTSAGAPAQQPGIGAVAVLSGGASATDSAMRRRTLAANDRIFKNETIETEPRTRLLLRLDDGTEISMGEQSQLVLDDYLLDPKRPQDTVFTMRVLRGLCRVVTGVLTRIAPERFAVRTRLATVGIRGCDVGIRSAADHEEFSILAVAPERSVRVETTADGAAVRNVLTGKELPVDDAKRRTFDVTQPGTRIRVAPGRAPESGPIPGGAIREFIRDVSPLPAARYEMRQSPDDAVLRIRPENQAAPSLPAQER